MPAIEPKPTPAKLRPIAEQYAAALSAWNPTAAAGLFDENVHFSFAGKTDVRGRAEVIQAHAAILSPFDEQKLTVGRIFRADEMQVVEWTLSGVHARPWMGLAATHKPVVIHCVSLLWVADWGTLLDVHVYFDILAAKAQLAGEAVKGAASITGPRPSEPLPSSGGPSVFVAAGTAKEDEDEATVRAELAALEKGNEADFLATMTDDVEIVLDGSSMRGKDEAKQYFRAARRAFGQLDTTIGSVVGVSGDVIVEYTIEGAQLARIGPIAFVPNRTVTIYVLDVVEMRNGHIARVRRWEDSDALSTWPAQGASAPSNGAPGATDAGT